MPKGVRVQVPLRAPIVFFINPPSYDLKMLFQLPSITGTLDHRILLNYTIDPEYLKNFLPAPFKPRLYKGVGVGGVCMIRFAGLRPNFAPAFLGVDSENAAHRIAVEWATEENPTSF